MNEIYDDYYDLYNGDCLQIMDRLIEDGVTVDSIITDIPYGTTACKWDTVIPFDEMWKRIDKLIKPNGAICLFGSEPFSSYLRMSNIKNYKYDWVWDKVTATGMTSAKAKPMKEHEIISVFCKSKCLYYPIMEIMNKPERYKCYTKSESEPLKYNDNKIRIRDKKYPKSIIKISNANHKGKLHPTQKPVALMEYLIKTYTLEGETVLDFTMGSGSTGVACLNTNRKFIGIELDSNYFDIATKRIWEAKHD